MITSTEPTLPGLGVLPALAPIEEPGAPIDIARLNGGRQVEYINAALTQASSLLKAAGNRGGYDVVAKFTMTAHGDSRNIVLDVDMKAKKAGVASFAFRAVLDAEGTLRELPGELPAEEPKKKPRGRKKKELAPLEDDGSLPFEEGEVNPAGEEPTDVA